ncbi:unnamed protein product [Penicillium nalgiovense]|uniref:Uncharacterized protein n=1 Tax=Penicillium nalgiovense TaxID=60175 RepID=A0A9W4HFK3_PENNA|nr:unnamed protein product [Penicillium nalgiovense]CAG7943549.1 unnamed protein product [Penicillium nalgiovense]CAG7943641.1 unnamed protein product [Penicillium nalgiovense]CAG7967270.1 unnamed protein product [Penicillium nalgiovense]CAG7968494.1 unnamed protein product [Penicillium nalgiovense]
MCAAQCHYESALFLVAICARLMYITLPEAPYCLFRLSYQLHPTMAFKYPQFEPYGDRLIRWMENANEPGCPVPITTLTSWTLPRPMDWNIEHEIEWLKPELISSIVGLGLPVGDLIPNHMDPTESPCVRHSIIKTRNGVTGFVGTIGPGLLFFYSIRRSQVSNDPYVSELAKMAYEMHYPLDGLKYIFMNDILEASTEPFIEEQIYPSREGAKYRSAERQTWDYPSPEFSAIMGTPIGKVVGSFILGAFGQGVKRVARIVTFQNGEDFHKLDIRFDIEDV